MDLTDSPAPIIFGAIEHIANGPAQSFLHVVQDFEWDEEKSQREHLIELVKTNFETKIPDDGLKEIYQSCYENTIRNLEDEKIELAPAGALAARFLVFDLFD